MQEGRCGCGEGLECRGESERCLGLPSHSESLRCDSEGCEGFEQVKNGKLKGPHAPFPRGNAKTLAPPTVSCALALLASRLGSLRLLVSPAPFIFRPLLSVPNAQDTLPTFLTNPGPTFLPEISLVFMLSRPFG